MRTFQSSILQLNKSLTSPQANKTSILVLIAGLVFFVPWLANYSLTIIVTPYPAEYREGAMLLLTDFLINGVNPFSLENHPLMTNNYGFLYNLVVWPFTIVFGNTLAIHRAISILFILASCTLIVLILIETGSTLPFALAGGVVVMGSLLFHVTPLARPDGLGEFLFLLSVLLPWWRKFDTPGLIASGLIGILAFLTKPYFVLSIGIVAGYVFFFVSKKKGSLYILSVVGSLILVLYIINTRFECYFLDVVLNNVSNSRLSVFRMVQQLMLFVEIFLPCILILFFAVDSSFAARLFSKQSGSLREHRLLNIADLNQPLINSQMSYFGFFLECTLIVVIVLLGRHGGAYMTYFFQLITPGLILVIFQRTDILREKAVIAVPLILINLSIICFWTLYPNKLLPSQRAEWEKLYRYIASSNSILNSPVLVPEMIYLGMMPVDSGQSEYFFYNRPYAHNLFAPDYEDVLGQGEKYLESVRVEVQNQSYDYVIVTAGQDPNHNSGFVVSREMLSPFAERSVIDQFYEQVEFINIAMPQTGQYWIVEVDKPRKK